MEIAYQVCKALLIVAFLLYGYSCLRSETMAAEFERFGLARFRILTGTLEVLGALGLFAGYFYSTLVSAASGGLGLLMLMGITVRARLRDPLLAMLPALVFLLINFFVFALSLRG